MSNKQLKRKRGNGIFYTPETIATLLSSCAIDGREISIFDPACGNGNLLAAALKACKGLGKRGKLRLIGCDKFRQRNLDRQIKFVHSDFFAFKTNEKFDVILTNPPYIQSARINPTIRERYYTRYAKPLDLSAGLDLWAYFLIKCSTHLKIGGTIAAILPWSFLEAKYAQKIRKWIAENFKKIQVLVLQGAHFSDTVKRVLLVWLKEYGTGAQNIKLGYADKCDRKPNLQDLPIKLWNSENVMEKLNPETSSIMRRLQKVGFKPLEEYGDVSIGVVTGANEYFILPEERAARLGFCKSSVLRILTSVEDLRNAAKQDSNNNKVLIQFKGMSKKKRNYIRKGYKLGLNKRAHCLRRKEKTGLWYAINADPVPDAFFTYRVSIIPYLLQNPDSYQCTNAIHKVFFNKASKNEQKWIQLSLLSLFGQLSLEMRGRHYGSGIIKIEPGVLKRSLVYASKARIKKKTYDNILQALLNGNKNYACLEATRVIAKEASINDNFVDTVLASVNRIRTLREAAVIHRNGKTKKNAAER